MEPIEIEGFAQRFPDMATNADGIAYSKDGARAYFVTLTPEMAKRILEFNTDNYRKIRPRHVRFLQQEMAAGEFLMNGDPIRFDTREIVSDGQHRLSALAAQDQIIEIEFLIVDRLPPDTTKTINANALARSYIDHLRRLGYPNPTMRSAVSILWHKWVNDRDLDSRYPLSIQQLDEVAEPIKDRLSWAVANGSRHRKLRGIQPALVALSYLILGEISETAVKTLFIGASEGENIHRGMPSYTLRDRFQDDYYKSVKRTKAEQLFFVFRAFDVEFKNMFRPDDDPLTILRLLPLPPGGVSTRDLKRMLVNE